MVGLINSLFLIFSGAAVFSTLALFTRQSLLVAYILLGVLIGPWGFNLIDDTYVIENVGDVGIIFLLFLLGLHLHPHKLLQMLKKMSWITFVSSVAFFLLGYLTALTYGYEPIECFVVGAAATFSSTIICLKLLPQSVLHEQQKGDVMIGILLLQDLLAIVFLVILHALGVGVVNISDFTLVFLSLPLLVICVFVGERVVLMPLLRRFDGVEEYTFLVSVAWCLGIAELGHLLDLSREVGAFVAGVALATSPIALYIADCLKPLRDFFLVMFFFSIGASFDLTYFRRNTLLPALILATLLLALKPVIYRFLFRPVIESKAVAWELGIRLGQVSEFSLLISAMAHGYALISSSAANLVQAMTILTFVASSYLTVLLYPTPLEPKEAKSEVSLTSP